MNTSGFRDLLVWQKAKELAVSVYRVTSEGRISQDPSLRDRMREAAITICSRIAEGDEHHLNRDAVHFFYLAKGSLAALMTQMEIACDTEYLSPESAALIQSECDRIDLMLGGLIRARSY